MMTLTFAFWLFVFLFAVIGAMRGWAKELLVMFSVILSLFILNVLTRYVPPIRDFLGGANAGATGFWLRSTVVVTLVFFGYQTPNITRFAGGNRFVREKLSDTLLGFFLGALNGYLIVSTLWFFLAEAQYPFPKLIIAPDPNNPLSAPALRLIPYLAPRWLGIPQIYFAIAIAFLFVLVVFI
jgi:uncharacterized membrane protein required for colicin V production